MTPRQDLGPARSGGCDLHIHTTASDGSLSPTEVVAIARASGLEAIAITDHDTASGLEEGASAAAQAHLAFVPGIEINTDVDGAAADVLGYFVDPGAPALAALAERIRRERIARADAIIGKIEALGVPLRREAVHAKAGGATVGRPHIARALVDAGAAEDVASAFRNYIGRGAPAFVDRYHILPEEACRAIRAAGGVPGLAHPLRPDAPSADPLRLTRLLPGLVEAGLGCLECYYPGFTPAMTRRLLALARHFGLVPTGGTDFHGPWHVGHEMGTVTVPLPTVDDLRRAARDLGGT